MSASWCVGDPSFDHSGQDGYLWCHEELCFCNDYFWGNPNHSVFCLFHSLSAVGIRSSVSWLQNSRGWPWLSPGALWQRVWLQQQFLGCDVGYPSYILVLSSWFRVTAWLVSYLISSNVCCCSGNWLKYFLCHSMKRTPNMTVIKDMHCLKLSMPVFSFG